MNKIILVLCIVALLCTGCGVSGMKSQYPTFENISSLYSKDEQISSNNNSYNLNSNSQNIDGMKYTGKITFEGMDTIWEYDADSDSDIEISYLLSVSSGKAKLVLISPNEELTTIVENTDNITEEALKTVNISLKKGKSRIKLVAVNKAHIDMKLVINVGNIKKLG